MATWENQLNGPCLNFNLFKLVLVRVAIRYLRFNRRNCSKERKTEFALTECVLVGQVSGRRMFAARLVSSLKRDLFSSPLLLVLWKLALEKPWKAATSLSRLVSLSSWLTRLALLLLLQQCKESRKLGHNAHNNNTNNNGYLCRSSGLTHKSCSRRPKLSCEFFAGLN